MVYRVVVVTLALLGVFMSFKPYPVAAEATVIVNTDIVPKDPSDGEQVLRITLNQEAKTVKVSHKYLPIDFNDFKPIDPDSIQAKMVTITEKALGSGKHWSVKIDSLHLEKQVKPLLTDSPGFNVYDSGGLSSRVVLEGGNSGWATDMVVITIECTKKDGSESKKPFSVWVRVQETRKNDDTIERKVVAASLKGYGDLGIE